MSFLLSVAIKAIILIVIMMCRYAECHYAECRYAECRRAIQTTMLSVVMLNVVGPYRQVWFTVELILIGVPSLVSWHHQYRVKALVSKILV
jgi:hypothetical protein